MNTTILTLLRHDARAWWYHAKLREQNNVEEARKREREAIRHAVDVLRLPPEEHFHRTHYVGFLRDESATSRTACVSSVHNGEWAAFHLIHGWMKCFEPVPNLRRY